MALQLVGSAKSSKKLPVHPVLVRTKGTYAGGPLASKRGLPQSGLQRAPERAARLIIIADSRRSRSGQDDQ